ncbi:MAG: class B sortase [Coriobacteriaceae bacterium]|nr:class B sortase [Coriobacteriaceae bacterium]
MSARTKSRIALGIAAVALVLVVAIVASIIWMERTANDYLSPDTTYTEHEGELFPDIDWDYWLSVNPDVIGWITVPDTNIDHPIVQAHEDDPTYYLYHDVYRNWNFCGVPYLDYRCVSEGLDSPNATVYGHHLRNGTMFSVFSEFSEASFAKEHRTILLQTPSSKRIVSVTYADVVDASTATNRFDFGSRTAYASWYQDNLDAADVVLDAQVPEHNYLFVTCSYTTWADERTLVAAADRWVWRED